MENQKGLDFLRAILGGQDQNTGLPLFTDQDVPVSNVKPKTPWETSPLGKAITDLPEDNRNGAQRVADFAALEKQRRMSPEELAATQQQNKREIAALPDNAILDNPMNTFLKNATPKSDSGNSPLTPAQLRNFKEQASSEDVVSTKLASSEVAPSALKQAPISGVKQSFQATQSPEQKLAAQQLADSQNPLVDNQMQAALAQAKEQSDTNQRRKALFEMMAGIGSLGGSKMSSESESLDNAIKMQNAPVDQINQERDAYKKFLSNKEEMEKADPNSPVSKTMRDALSGMGVKIPQNASYATMENLAPQLMKNKEFQIRMQEMQLKRQELSQNKEAQKSLKAEQQIAKTRDSVLKSERYKNLAASTEAIQGARSNLELARKGYSQGYSALGANLAKLAGEKGMLSEADVNRYLVAKGVPGKLESGKLELTGKPTKQQIDALEQIVNSLESDVRKKGVQFAEDELAGYSQGLNVSPEAIESVLPELRRLKAGATQSSQPKSNKPKTIKQNGHTYTLNESTGEYE